MLLCPQKPSLFAQIIKQRSLNGSVCLKAPTEQTSVYSCSWKSNINSVLPQLSENLCWFHSVTSTNAIHNASISCWRLSWPTRWCLRLNSTSLRVTSEDFGHSTLPYVEVTGNFILSETAAAQTYYLPSYALWNSWWHWPLYLGTAIYEQECITTLHGTRLGQIVYTRLRMHRSSLNEHNFHRNLVDSTNCVGWWNWIYISFYYTLSETCDI